MVSLLTDLWNHGRDDMKEVKLVNLSDLTPNLYWGHGEREFPSSTRKRVEAQRGQQEVEQRLAGLLNEGWIITGTGGAQLGTSFVILVRDR